MVLRDTMRPKMVAEDSDEEEFEGYWLVMKSTESENVPDMYNWARLEKYIRTTLALPPASKFQIKLFTRLLIGDRGEVSLNIRDDISLITFRRSLKLRGAAELSKITAVELSVKEFKPLKLNKKKEPRTGAHAVGEKKTRDLATIIYGEGRGQQREGVWSDECNQYMAKHPKELRAFFKMRATVAKARASLLRRPALCLA